MTKWTKIEDYRLDVVPFDDFDDIDTVDTARLHDCVFPDYMIADLGNESTAKLAMAVYACKRCARGCPFESDKRK